MLTPLSLTRGAPSHPALFFWYFQVSASIQGLAEREGQREQVGSVLSLQESGR